MADTQMSPGMAKMYAFARLQPTATLCEGLTALEAKPTLDEPERLTRAVLIDVLTARHPEADAAFDAWAAGPTWMTAPAVEAITTAALAAAKEAETIETEAPEDDTQPGSPDESYWPGDVDHAEHLSA